MRKRFLLLAVAAMALYTAAIAQQKIMPNPYYNVIVTPVGTNQGLPVQSFVAGRQGDTLLIIGGRTKGLHNFNAPSFPYNTNNRRLYVFIPAKDASGKSQWYSTGIPTSLTAQQQLQLASTNMEYCQTGNTLFALGGYGYNGGTGSDSSYGTFNGFYAVQVSGLINAIVKGDTAASNIASYFTFSSQPSPSDSTMAVTGGELVQMGSDYYLVMGQNFQGEYAGNNYQVYMNKVTHLQFSYSAGSSLTYKVIDVLTNNAQEFHRRDLNVVPSIATNGQPGIDVLGGVFTPTSSGGPYVYPVYIRNNKLRNTTGVVDTSLTQYFNLYSSAHALLYSKFLNSMQSCLLGGITLYSSVADVNKGKQIAPADTSMPWSNIISTIIRDTAGVYTEYASDANLLPGFIGAEAKFVPHSNLLYGNSEEILDFDQIVATAVKNLTLRVDIGYVVGGIKSVDAAGSSTNSNPALYKVEIQFKTPFLQYWKKKK